MIFGLYFYYYRVEAWQQLRKAQLEEQKKPDAEDDEEQNRKKWTLEDDDDDDEAYNDSQNESDGEEDVRSNFSKDNYNKHSLSICLSINVYIILEIKGAANGNR